MIGHMKADGLPGRNWFHGELGDAMHAVLCGAGHNLRMILRYLRVLGWPVAAALAWLSMVIASLPTPSAATRASVAD
jgi:IS5 family transposase